MDDPVVIIGGGITGIGTARDLAMRGVKVVVVERGEIGCETSTDFHGMLHSGARYAVKDPFVAKKCFEESQILKEIAEDYIEDTGGLFVKLKQDSEEYYQEKLEACRDFGIPVEELSAEEVQEKESKLSEDIEKALKIPDGVLRPVKLLEANRRAAEENGARTITHTEVKNIVVENGEVEKLEIEGKAQEEKLEPAFVVNATGPWAEKTGELAGLDISMNTTKGVLTVVENPGVTRVLNRCRPTEDGDIVLPKGDKAVIGTTSEAVENPDDYPKDEEEEQLMVEQGHKMAEGISNFGLIDSYWGLRPLYSPSEEEEDERDITREFHLIDHADDNIENMATVVGGKWTTYRYMAEKTSNLVCEKLGLDSECRTDEVPLPDDSSVETDRAWPPV